MYFNKKDKKRTSAMRDKPLVCMSSNGLFRFTPATVQRCGIQAGDRYGIEINETEVYFQRDPEGLPVKQKDDSLYIQCLKAMREIQRIYNDSDYEAMTFIVAEPETEGKFSIITNSKQVRQWKKRK